MNNVKTINIFRWQGTVKHHLDSNKYRVKLPNGSYMDVGMNNDLLKRNVKLVEGNIVTIEGSSKNTGLIIRKDS